MVMCLGRQRTKCPQNKYSENADLTMDANQELINRKQKCMKKVWVPQRKNEGNKNLDS